LSCSTKSPPAPPTAATESPSPSSLGSRLQSSRARAVLAKLEAGRDATGGIAAGLDDLPLFAATAETERAPEPLAEALDEIDPDRLTPRQALDQLYRLKRIAAERGT
jgi:hypothetical protein